MTSPPKSPASTPTMPGPVATVFRWLASLQLAVTLIVILAVVLAVTTFIEASKGREYVRWYVYNSQWFIALLGLLALNIFAATVARFSWKKSKFWFLLTHAGLLVLLAGSIETFRDGIDGDIVVPEGETVDRIVLRDHCQVVVHWMEVQRQDRLPAAFVFEPGPVDWPEGKTLDLGEASGVHLRVTRFYCHAQTQEDWVDNKSKDGLPAIKFALASAGGVPAEGQWLVAGPFGSLASMGPLEFEFQRTPVAKILDAFLKPPAMEPGTKGILSVHYGDRVQQIPVDSNIGKKVPLGDGKVSVELVEYLPNAQPSTDFRFVSEGKEPKNPFLELKVYLSDKKEPMRQIAFANHPFQSFDGIHGRTCPVKFWYHHPAAAANAGVQFLQTPDGKLYCRVGIDGKYRSQGEVKAGDKIDLPGQFRAVLVRHLPHARREVSFHPVEHAAEENGAPGAAACLEVTACGKTREVWLKRDDQEFRMQRLSTAEGPLALVFGYGDCPLGFSLRLQKFERGLNPGGMGEASYSSTVRLVDQGKNIDEDRDISMNQPLAHGKFAFYQTGFDSQPDGKAVSILSVAYDPGRFLKYLGSLMVCAGTLLMLCRKAGIFARLPFAGCRRAGAPEKDGSAGQDDSPSQHSGPEDVHGASAGCVGSAR